MNIQLLLLRLISIRTIDLGIIICVILLPFSKNTLSHSRNELIKEQSVQKTNIVNQCFTKINPTQNDNYYQTFFTKPNAQMSNSSSKVALVGIIYKKPKPTILIYK